MTEIAGVRDQGNFIDLNSVRRDKRGGTPMCLDIGCEDVSERGYEDIRENFGYKDVLASSHAIIHIVAVRKVAAHCTNTRKVM